MFAPPFTYFVTTCIVSFTCNVLWILFTCFHVCFPGYKTCVNYIILYFFVCFLLNVFLSCILYMIFPPTMLLHIYCRQWVPSPASALNPQHHRISWEVLKIPVAGALPDLSPQAWPMAEFLVRTAVWGRLGSLPPHRGLPDSCCHNPV